MKKEHLHEKNRAWLDDFSQLPHHSLVVELNHPLEAEPILAILAQALQVKAPVMVGSEATVAIEDVREVQRLAKLRKNEAERHFFVLDVQSGISIAAQNSLLKLLEEPPQNTFFALIVLSTSQVLPTIRSRSRTVRILPLPEQQFQKQLLEANSALTEADLRRFSAMFHNSFAAAGTSELADFDQVRQFLGAPFPERLKRLKTIKERAAAEKFLDDLLLLSVQTLRSTASHNKPTAAEVWVNVAERALRAQTAINQNGNVSLHLQRLALTIPAMN